MTPFKLESTKHCRNPRCDDLIVRGRFCPSCRYMMRRSLATGMFVGGIIVAIIKWRMGR